jgi:hypothetical protein
MTPLSFEMIPLSFVMLPSKSVPESSEPMSSSPSVVRPPHANAERAAHEDTKTTKRMRES